MRLRDRPDLLYLVREYDRIYRHGSSGGSRPIRGHLRRVREGIADVVEADPEVSDRAPASLPVTDHLGRALDAGSRGVLGGLADALGRVAGLLTWEYGYEKVPRGLTGKYGYCEIVGPRGPVVTDELILGLVLFAPDTIYPQHHHRDIEESYVAISGAWSENDTAVYAPGSLILNVPAHEHRITTGPFEPCLLAYAWLGPVERLTTPGMRFSARRPRR
ncbi:dimethylsulfonioproprionate lyase family protein [Phycicoccus flavus]|uniref:dimethylsulfonioproprionate lyase family protein n=1 Tax=Phycicoccus flavus TaxID=2502783 RepID=UPI000FEB6D86|nr:dimethylsulfonioproprionate lyase family protein [Phycicoccus flavus]NHA66476.1 dimethlysulfonioproprionate lyase DddL [Phycicoccus flavus]